MGRMSSYTITPVRGRRLMPALPLLCNLLLGSIGAAFIPGCQIKQPAKVSKVAEQRPKIKQKIRELRDYFYENKNLFSITDLSYCIFDPYYYATVSDGAISVIIANGWDVKMLKELSAIVHGSNLPGLSPKLIFSAPQEDSPLGQIEFSCLTKELGSSMVINIPLVDIKWIADPMFGMRHSVLHELSHAEDLIYFSNSSKYFNVNISINKARSFLIKHVPKISTKRKSQENIENLIRSLEKRTNNNENVKSPLSIRLADIRSEEKLPLKYRLGHLQIAMTSKKRKANYESPNPRIDDLAYFLIIADKLEEQETSAHLREIACKKLRGENKQLFDDLYELFDLQYEVSKRFIDRNTVLKKRPFFMGGL